ncbi:MAG TPA: hypothetical protein VF718_13035 [Allosphingosinicella sp.]|jgi:hypothetical protein
MMLVDLSGGRSAPGWALPSIVLALALVLGGGYWVRTKQSARAVGADGCFLHQPAPALEILAFDDSDPLVAANRRRLDAALVAAVAALPEGGRLVIVRLGDDAAAEPRQAFKRCAPIRPEDVNPLVRGGPDVRPARERFLRGARQALAKAADVPATDTSPIVQRVGAIVTFPDFVGGVSGPKTLRLASDGLQNHGDSSFYRSEDPPVRAAPGLLAGWTVHFIQTTNARDARLQTPAMRGWWEKRLREAGAGSITFEGAGFVDALAGPAAAAPG